MAAIAQEANTRAAIGGGLLLAGLFSMGMGFVFLFMDVPPAVNGVCCGLGVLLFALGLYLAIAAGARRKATSPPTPGTTAVAPSPSPAIPVHRYPFCPKCGSGAIWDGTAGRWRCTGCGDLLPEHIPRPGTIGEGG